MFSKKKIEDQFDKIINTGDLAQKALLLKKQIEFFKSQKPEFEYEYKDFLLFIEEFQTSNNYEYNLLWVQLINEIIRLNPSMKKKYFKSVMKIIFSENNNNEEENDEKKDEINKIKIDTIKIFTKKCEEIFEIDTYFQNLNHLKMLLKLLIMDLLPYYYNKDINILLLMISNLFDNINKNIENKKYLKSNYFSIIFNLLIEILCFQSLFFSFKILEIKTLKSKKNTMINSNYSYIENSISNLEINFDVDKEIDKKGIISYLETTTKNNLLDLMNKINKLFNMYLNINPKEKNNLNIIVNYQILMKIFLVHCMESEYNEKDCIEWFNLIINNFKMNKILKMITESFDDEIFNLFYINKVENNSSNEGNTNPDMLGINILGNNKLKSINIFFYLCEYITKEIETKNYYNNFIMKFCGLRNKLLQNKEYINNGLFILINLLLNDILSKNNKTLNFEEEIIILTLIKCVMKYIIKTNIVDMSDINKDNINNLVNLLIDRFGECLSEKIWKELMVLIKYYYFELSKHKNKFAMEEIKSLLKKMLKLKINGNCKFDENLFYDILNKVYDNKNNNSQINDYVLYSVYIKNKFKNSKYFNKNISSCTDFFITLIKDKYNSFEVIDSIHEVNEIIKSKENKKKNYEEILDTLANYLMAYFNTYSKYENKNIELFLYQNFIHLNFYFSTKKSLQSQYIKFVIENLNNTNDFNYYQCLISFLISSHSNQSNTLIGKENLELAIKLYKKIIIKLIKKLSETSQVEKLRNLFESIFNRLNACLNDEIDYKFINNILEVFGSANITKFDEILINNKSSNNYKIDNINESYLNIGHNCYTSILVGENKKLSEKISKEWCVVDIKELFSILLKLLKINNIIIECKEKIINFIKDKISDIFFFNKLDVESFIDYVIDLDKDNLKIYILYMEKTDIIIAINEILIHLAYLMLYHKHLFDIKNYKEFYDKLIKYSFEKINYIKKLIRLIIHKYDIKVLKNKNWKTLNFMKTILGADVDGIPNIDHLKLDATDFKVSKRDKEKDANYHFLISEDIPINKFVYPKKNFSDLIKYYKSYFNILEIALNSLSYIYIKNYSIVNLPFTKQIEEKKLNIHFDKNINIYHIHNQEINNLSNFKLKNNPVSEEIQKKYNSICEKFFEMFNKYPVLIKYHSQFLVECYKLFLYSKDFLISCGEKYVIMSILILFSITFPENYNKFYEKINNEFKQKFNEGKDFTFYKIESVQINTKNNNSIESIMNNLNNYDPRTKRVNSVRRNNLTGSTFVNNFNNSNNNSRNSLTESKDFNKHSLNDFHSKSMVILQESKIDENIDRKESVEEINKNMQSSETINVNYNIIKNNKNIDSKNELSQSIIDSILIIRKLMIEFITKSKHSLKIYNIIKELTGKKNSEENLLFLLYCKWKIVNKENTNRNEDIKKYHIKI